MGFFSGMLDLLLAATVIVGGVISVISLSFFGAFVKALPFLIKLGAVAVLAYFGLSIFGII